VTSEQNLLKRKRTQYKRA